MFNKLYQNVINQMREATKGQEIGIINENSIIIACSDPDKNGTPSDISFKDYNNGAPYEPFALEGYTYIFFENDSNSTHAIFIEGDTEISFSQISMISATLNLTKYYYDDKYDKNKFIKNIILGNTLQTDSGIKPKDFNFNSEVNRVVFFINIISQPSDINTLDAIQKFFPNKAKDFIFNITENDIVLVKETSRDTKIEDLEKLARSISDSLLSEFYVHISIGIGRIVDNIRDLTHSFQESKIALEVGRFFDNDEKIACYSNLGIARLIHNLPKTLCETFLEEVFNKGSVDSLDHETLFTIQKFFENNLNVSETSRKLFVHRNTLVYRLDKIKKLTGLDLREFEDAIIFKIALMVKKFLSNRR